METNFEHYKDELIKALLTSDSDKCNFINKYILPFNCKAEPYMTCARCQKMVKEWLDKPYTKPEIDWSKVPTNTLVLVKNYEDEEADKIFRHFAHYEEGAVAPFCCFANGQTFWTSSEGLYNWKYCELVNKEDKIKYKKD